MQLELNKRPKNVTIIEGFPGLGLVGTIVTGFLIEHLKAKSIGRIWSHKLMPVVAIHEGEAIEPLEIFYSKKYNIVIINALSNVAGLEWELSQIISELSQKLTAKEVISIEGVGSQSKTSRTFYFTNSEKKKKLFKKINVEELKEGIAMGVTAALLLKLKKTPHSCIFAETHSKLPDSRAAAEVIKVLDNSLNLKIDYKPLIKKAEEFESKLQGLAKQSQKAIKGKRDSTLDYLG